MMNMDDLVNSGPVDGAIDQLEHGLVEMRALRVMLRRDADRDAAISCLDDARLRAKTAIQNMDLIEERVRMSDDPFLSFRRRVECFKDEMRARGRVAYEDDGSVFLRSPIEGFRLLSLQWFRR